MKIRTAEVIATGTELLQGRTLNRHGFVLGERLVAQGVVLQRETVLPDDPAAIETCIRAAMQRADLVLVTGGLGPTDDDRTRDAAAAVFGREVVRNAEADAHMEAFYQRRNILPTEMQRRQARIVEGSTVWLNPVGLAPGQLLEHEDGAVILLPGPPRELRGILDEHFCAWLEERAPRESGTIMRTCRIVGLSESAVQERVVEALPASSSLELSYCPRLGSVECRVTGKEAEVLAASEQIRELFAEDWLNGTGASTEETLSALLVDRGLTLATAESCTAGGIGEALTNVPGSSAYFAGGVIAYSNEVKVQSLGVSAGLLAREGAVSAEVAAAMAEGARERFGVDLAVSITGIAGPGGGTEEKPVGLFYIGVAAADGTETFRYVSGGNRGQIRAHGVQRALEQLWRRVRRMG